jgi:hypothetical protein
MTTSMISTHHIGRDVLETFGQVEARERLDDADDQTADDGARQAAEAADHRRRKGLEPDEAHVGVHEGDGRQQHAGDRGDRRGQAPHQAVQPLDRNAHVVGRQLVLRSRLHRDADLAVLEHRVEQPHSTAVAAITTICSTFSTRPPAFHTWSLYGTGSVWVSVPMFGIIVIRPRAT